MAKQGEGMTTAMERLIAKLKHRTRSPERGGLRGEAERGGLADPAVEEEPPPPAEAEPRAALATTELPREAGVEPVKRARSELVRAYEGLFGRTTDPRQMGRYAVLDKLGEGGMGVVLQAYDRELGRKVALKVLHPELDERYTQRLRREAQAMAKLSHPNVVQVYEVGEIEGRTFVAMELVKGQALDKWIRRRPGPSWRECVSVFLQLGAGLAAAHERGLVHRDFKPANAILDEQGRARVLDFGLARRFEGIDDSTNLRTDEDDADPLGLDAMITRPGTVMGTPAYMPPEQMNGDEADARSDQFSFCVALYEALYGERPFAGRTPEALMVSLARGVVRPVPKGSKVPGWLRRVCLQGLAADPGRRFASMQALLDALSQGRARARARNWLVGVATVAVLGVCAALYQHHDRAERVAACEANGAGIFAVWNDEARVGVRDGIVATGLSYAPVTAEKVMPFLDAQAEAWREHRTRACLAAEVEETLSAEHLDRAVWCLDERRMELAALATELTRADATVVRKAITAAAGLPPVSPCIDVQVLAALPPPPPMEARARIDEVRAMLSRARTLLSAGRLPDGLKEVRSALAEAETLGWLPLTAAVRRLEGNALEQTGAYAEAEAASLAAYMVAAKVRAWDVAASAAVDLEYNIGYRQARHAEGKVWAGHAEVALSLAGDPLTLGEAGRLGNLALVHAESGAYLEAKALHERTLAIREKALGPEHPGVAISLNNLALVYSDMGWYAEAKVLHERALAIREKTLGPEHPLLAASLNNLANVHNATGSNAEAKVLHQRALAIREKTLGLEHIDSASTLHNLANVHFDMEAYEEAKVLNERALAIKEKALGPEHTSVAASLNNLANVHKAMGAYAEAKVLNERGLAIQEKALGPEHPDVAISLSNLANVHADMGAYAEAKALNERALAIREKALGPEHIHVAHSLNNLALVHNAMGAYAEAKALHERALAVRDKVLGPEHPNLAQTLNNLANVHYEMGSYAEAKALNERALAIQEKVLGPDHTDVAISLNNLALVHNAMGAYAEAKALHERALAVRDKVLGPEHPDVAISLNNLGVAVASQGKHEDARGFHERALSIREKTLGPEHPLLACSLWNLGESLLALAKPIDALPLLERALTICTTHDCDTTWLAGTRFALARALWVAPDAQDHDRSRARTLAEQARDAYAMLGEANKTELADVRTWLAEHRVR